MKLTFIRADHEVTGSCTLLEIGGHYGLIDCGMEQGRDLFENIAIPVPAAGSGRRKGTSANRLTQEFPKLGFKK